MDDPCLGAEAQVRLLEEVLIGIIVRQATRSDRPAIATFIEEAYGDRAQYKGAPRWTWQFLDNPFGPQSGDEVPVWIALDGERVVGQTAVQNAILQVDGKTFDAGWAVDIMILPSHRGAGIGHRMHEVVASDVGILVAVKMAESSRRMAERLGCVTLAEVPQLTRWVRLDPSSVRRYVMLRTASHRRPNLAARVACNVFQAHRLFSLLVNPVLRLRDLVEKSLRKAGATRIVEIDRFGPDVDELSRRTQGDYPVIFPRDARFLNWRFVDCPEPRYRRFVAERDGRAVGYVVLRRAEPVELPHGIIVDLYAARGDEQTVNDLVRHSLAFFGNDVSAVDCGTSVPEFEAVLRKHGFFRTRAHRPTCLCQDSTLRDRLAQLRGDWFISKGDHDWDQIAVADPAALAD